jgi:hypothetical protein
MFPSILSLYLVSFVSNEPNSKTSTIKPAGYPVLNFIILATGIYVLAHLSVYLPGLLTLYNFIKNREHRTSPY